MRILHLLPHAQPCPSAPSRKRREYIHDSQENRLALRDVLQQQVRTFRPSLSGQIQKRARREVFIFPNTHPLHPPESSSRQTVQQCRRLRLEQLARIHRLAQPYVLDLLRISRPGENPLDDLTIQVNTPLPKTQRVLDFDRYRGFVPDDALTDFLKSTYGIKNPKDIKQFPKTDETRY